MGRKKKAKLLKFVKKEHIGRVLDICDNIISVGGLNHIFSGEFIRFQSMKSEIFGFV
jgi:F0F1-type ATP synthase alpha subunit